MASRQHRGKMAAQGPKIKSFGEFTIVGYDGDRQLTISRRLDPEPFPNEPGTKLKVEQINPEDEPAYLRLIPTDVND